ncbi:hypothetical protein ATE92_2480 [Ulvibacter sp. MAR_2010_11]|uniref:hypothetical protein n=1 Tax=Ulvibacter sp. MAR_2010_11 TaxID=1250229 RepID=UPI000C2C7375|nr:hypothetical protein [Ulvibacter sp. MAR_2010_11]PKA84299.1 hypothetical protein ATE92_2480 [Ulvibacter sp. MAR_2010_11]
MKHLILSLLFTSTLLLTSCEGDQGPPGDPGINILGQVFEVTVDFTASNNYEQLIVFPSNVEVYESDVVLVYLLEGVTSGGIDIWSQLPQTFFVPQGTLIYNFDYTFLDVRLYLYGDFSDFSTLGTQYTNDQTFRVAIVPSEFANANLTMDELLQNLQIETSQIPKID